MILPDKEILALIRSQALGAGPFEEQLVQPCSLDLRLGLKAKRLRAGVSLIDTNEPAAQLEQHFEELEFPHEGYDLLPNASLLVQTLEVLKIPSYCQGAVLQRSSLLRVNLDVSSSIVNPGYEGNLPCAIYNQSGTTVRIYPGIPFCQLVLHRLASTPAVTYENRPDAKYQGERTITPSSIGDDVKKWRSPGIRLANPADAERLKPEVLNDGK